MASRSTFTLCCHVCSETAKIQNGNVAKLAQAGTEAGWDGVPYNDVCPKCQKKGITPDNRHEHLPKKRSKR